MARMKFSRKLAPPAKMVQLHTTIDQLTTDCQKGSEANRQGLGFKRAAKHHLRRLFSSLCVAQALESRHPGKQAIRQEVSIGRCSGFRLEYAMLAARHAPRKKTTALGSLARGVLSRDAPHHTHCILSLPPPNAILDYHVIASGSFG